MSAARGILCLNLRHEHVAGLGAAEVLARAERELGWFRAARLPVFHAYVRRPRDQGRPYGALAGLEPRWDEPVFALPHVAALSGADIAAMSARVRRLHVVGDSSLAAAIQRAGLACAPVSEACFTRTSEFDERAERARRACAAEEGNIIWVKSWR